MAALPQMHNHFPPGVFIDWSRIIHAHKMIFVLDVPKVLRSRMMDVGGGCSVLIGEPGLRRLRKIAKMPWFKHLSYIAHLAVDESSGVAKSWPGDPNHFSFWLYSSFDAVAAVTKSEAVL